MTVRDVEPMVVPDPLGDPFILMVKSASKPGKWHRVKWWQTGGTDSARRLEYAAECESGFCELDWHRPSQECRHERLALEYLRGEQDLEALLAKSIEILFGTLDPFEGLVGESK